ncbi:MAG: rod shape-determining protein MreC [Candidatus Nitrotoga sp.]
MEHTRSFRFFNRGPSQAARLVFFALLSLLLLFVDARFKYLEYARHILFVPVSALQSLVTLPGKVWNEAGEYLITQTRLVRENEQLRLDSTKQGAQLQQLQVLQAEVGQLRTLLAVQQHAEYPMQLAEIIFVERNIFKRKLFLDKGSNANVLIGQIVIDEVGVVGQITRVYPWISEVTLITDKDHTVPVQVLRNGLRAIAFGSGGTADITLRYLPVNAEIEVGDVLVTSGIDGTYPPGLPVARVTKVERNPAYPFARITCTPLAGVDKNRQLLILTGLPKLPARPEAEVEKTINKPRKFPRKTP